MNSVKLMSVVGWMFLMLLTGLLKAQPREATRLKSTIEPLHLAIGDKKTTNLVFPYSIISVDRGSKEVLVQKAKGVENILQVKASGDSLSETNLTVITADGSLYSFLLQYAHEPSVLNLNLALSGANTVTVGVLPTGYENEAELRSLTERVSTKRPFLGGVESRKHAITLKVSGIFIEQGNLFFQISLQNDSHIRYDIDQLRFFIRDQKRSKRTAYQELEQEPIHIHGNPSGIGPNSTVVLVYVFPHFTIPDKKELIVQLMEKNGGRHLEVRLKNRKLLKSKVIR